MFLKNSLEILEDLKDQSLDKLRKLFTCSKSTIETEIGSNYKFSSTKLCLNST